MPRRTGLQWPAVHGRCDCPACQGVAAAETWAAAARAVAPSVRHATHYTLDGTRTEDGAWRFTAHEIEPEGDADYIEPRTPDTPRAVVDCWCPRCAPLVHDTPAAEASTDRQALPEVTPDPLAQVDAVRLDDAEGDAEDDDERSACASCGEDWDADDLRAVGPRGRMFCPDCRTECERCGDDELVDHAGPVYTGPRGSRGMHEQWCDDCTSDHSWRCARCDESMSTGSVCAQYAEDDRDEEQPICPACWTAEDEAPPVMFRIDSYHSRERRDDCRPVVSDWTRTHGARFFGVELEVEYAPQRNADRTPTRAAVASAMIEAARDGVAAWRDRGRRLLWAETDGSLADGFELISAPAGLDTQRALWQAVLACPEVRHLRSHDSTTCGLHVHLSRPGQWLTAKLAHWVALPSTEELVRLVARRYGSSYAHMTPRRLSRDTVRGFDRYCAVNTTGRATVELRIFRGSLRADTVLACVEFAHAAAAYVEDTSARDLDAPDTAARFLRRIHAPDLHKDTAHLRAYIAERTARFPRRAPRITQALAEMPRKTKTPAAPACVTTTESED